MQGGRYPSVVGYGSTYSTLSQMPDRNLPALRG
jgi:hypothetical protein